MKTIEDLRRHLNKTYSTLEAWVQLGEPDFFTGLEVTELADEAFRLACRFGCDVEPTTPTTALESMQAVGKLLAWATPVPETLTVKQAAERLGVSPRTIYDLCDAGRAAAMKGFDFIGFELDPRNCIIRRRG